MSDQHGVGVNAGKAFVEWHFDYNQPNQYLQHHDIEPLPNGNILLIAWDYKTDAEAVAAGRDPNMISGGQLLSDSVVEVQPTGPNSGTIVWAWYAFDHLVQDFDPVMPSLRGTMTDQQFRDLVSFLLTLE